jgi:hypothetical protein
MKSFIHETYNFEKCFHGSEFFLHFVSNFLFYKYRAKSYYPRIKQELIMELLLQTRETALHVVVGDSLRSCQGKRTEHQLINFKYICRTFSFPYIELFS